MFLSLAGAVFDVAFYHQTLYEALNICVLITAVNDVLGNTYLFKILFARVVVVGVNDDGGVYEVRFFVKLINFEKIFVVVI